jgi:hypothetical protein
MGAELRRTILVLADIGGYTRFIREHRTSLIHAEKIISDLMESVIGASRHPLTLNKLEGDAALFYAIADGNEAEVVQDVARQIHAFFPAFAAKRAELDACRICPCSACVQTTRLTIKAVAHTGDVVHKMVGRFEELAGEAVIVAHRLLKNTVKFEQYVLATRVFHDLSAGALGSGGVASSEVCEGIGRVPVVVYPVDAPRVEAPRVLSKSLFQFARFEGHLLKRLFGAKKAHEFKSLEGL